MKIGFIGLGIMGKPMSKNLMKAGYELVIYSRNQATTDELKALGAKAVESSADVAKESNVIITMLPNSPQLSPGKRSMPWRKRYCMRSF